MAKAPDCTIYTGKMHDVCVSTNARLGYDEHGNPLATVDPNTHDSGGSSFFGIPLPSSDWWRHFMFRAGEVIVGVAMVIVGIKALANSGDTTKVIVQGAKKVGKKI